MPVTKTVQYACDDDDDSGGYIYSICIRYWALWVTWQGEGMHFIIDCSITWTMNYYYFYFLEYEEFPQNKQSLPVYIFYCMCRRVFPQCVNVRNRVIRHTFTVKKPVPQGHNTTALSPTRVQYYWYCLARSPAAVSMSEREKCFLDGSVWGVVRNGTKW